MFRTAGGMAAALGVILHDLPPGFRTVEVGDSHLVVGPTGAFLLAAADRDLAGAAARLNRLAQRARVLLAARVGSTPFLDALVVAEPGPEVSPLTSIVAPRMVRDTLLAGPPLLTATAVDRLVQGARRVARDLVSEPGTP